MNKKTDNAITRALKKLNWTQTTLSEKTGINPNTLSWLIHKEYPSMEQADLIQKAFALAGHFIDVFEMIRPSPGITLDYFVITAPETNLNVDEELNPIMDKLKSTVDERLKGKVRSVIHGRFFENKTLQEIGDELGMTREGVRQYESKGLRILRHPETMKLLLK